jgi:uncharacterized protein (DUF3084 family)
MKTKYTILISTLILFCTLANCAPRSQLPFLSVQVCATNEEQLSQLISQIHSLAEEKNMSISHNEEEIQKQLIELQRNNPNIFFSTSTTNMVISQNNTVYAVANNIPSSRGQILISFFENRDSETAHDFAKHVVNRLEQYWHVTRISREAGAFPNDSCGDNKY